MYRVAQKRRPLRPVRRVFRFIGHSQDEVDQYRYTKFRVQDISEIPQNLKCDLRKKLTPLKNLSNFTWINNSYFMFHMFRNTIFYV